MSIALVAVLAGVWATQTYQYARVWTDMLPLTQYMAIHAPQKPRALMNYGILLAARGQFAGGRALFAQATRASQAPHIRPLDRRLFQKDITKNMAALLQLESSRP